MVTGVDSVSSRLTVVDRGISIRFVGVRPYSGIFVGARPTGRRTQSPRDHSSIPHVASDRCSPRVRVALRFYAPILRSRDVCLVLRRHVSVTRLCDSFLGTCVSRSFRADLSPRWGEVRRTKRRPVLASTSRSETANRREKKTVHVELPL